MRADAGRALAASAPAAHPSQRVPQAIYRSDGALGWPLDAIVNGLEAEFEVVGWLSFLTRAL